MLSLYLPVWDSTLAAIPDAVLAAIGEQALRDHANAYPLAAGDVLKTWQGFAPVVERPLVHPLLAPGETTYGTRPDEPPALVLTRLLTQAVLSRDWGSPPAPLVAALLTVTPDPVDAAATVAPMLRAAMSWADVAAWVQAGVCATDEARR